MLQRWALPQAPGFIALRPNRSGQPGTVFPAPRLFGWHSAWRSGRVPALPYPSEERFSVFYTTATICVILSMQPTPALHLRNRFLLSSVWGPPHSSAIAPASGIASTSVLHQRVIPNPSGDLFSSNNLDWLHASISIDSDGRDALDCQLRLLDRSEAEIALITALAHEDEQVKLFMTLPGVDFPIAQAILAAFGDISRFDSPNKAAAISDSSPPPINPATSAITDASPSRAALTHAGCSRKPLSISTDILDLSAISSGKSRKRKTEMSPVSPAPGNSRSLPGICSPITSLTATLNPTPSIRSSLGYESLPPAPSGPSVFPKDLNAPKSTVPVSPRAAFQDSIESTSSTRSPRCRRRRSSKLRCR